jgi:2,3-dihydroxybiphenyl 1,2-dioxygenase
MPVTQLGYVTINVSDLDAWRSVASDVLGVDVRGDEKSSDRLRFKVDDRHHRLTLQRSSQDKVAAIGWEVASPAALDAVAAAVEKFGIAVTRGSKSEALDRHVVDFFHFKDPEGFPLEIYFGPSADDVPFRPGRAMSGFNCGALGLGHVVLICKDCPAAAKFYQEILGFRLSDYIVWDEADATFLHCNPRHHSLAIMNECYGMKGGDIQHIMLEANSLDDVGRAYDLVQQRNIPLFLSLGQHSNDRMTSFYLKTPSGFAIEYGWGGRIVDDSTWQVTKYTTPKLWGHDLR